MIKKFTVIKYLFLISISLMACKPTLKYDLQEVFELNDETRVDKILWLPDMEHLILNIYDPHGERRVVELNIITHEIEKIFDWGPYRIENVSSDGKYLVINSNLDNWIVNIDQLNNMEYLDWGLDPALSPSGRQVIIVQTLPRKYETEHIEIIKLIDLKSGQSKTIFESRAEDPEAISYLSWSPDEESISFSFRPGIFSTDKDIFIMDIETGNIRKITNGDFNYDANWFPDGKQILYYYTNKETGFLRVVRLDSTKNCEFEIRNIGPVSDINLSPNGRYLAYRSYKKVKILDLKSTELGNDYLNVDKLCVP